MKKIIQLCFLCFGVFYESRSQTQEEKGILSQFINKEELERISILAETEYKEQYIEAIELAKKFKWPLQITDADGTVGHLIRVNEYKQPVYEFPLDQGGCQTISSNSVYPGGSLNLNLDGAGLLAGIWETWAPNYWVYTAHQDFQFAGSSRVQTGFDHPNETGLTTLPPSGHGTLVASTMLGSHTVSGGAYRGVADMANAYSLTSSYVTNELATLAQPPTNLIFANHSYGFPSSGTNSAYFDQVLVNAPHLFNVVANGNIWFNGYSDSKNSISVGKSYQVINYTNPWEVRGEQVYSNSIPVNIPDNTLVSSSITIPTGNPVNNISNTTYIDVRINISHPNVSDLKIYLVAPNNCGTLELSTNNGGNGDDYINTILTSTAIQNITTATAPFSNTFYLAEGVTHSPSGISYQAPTGLTGIFSTIPASSLMNCPMNPASATWKLYIGDDVSGNVGTLNSWSLSVNPYSSFMNSGNVIKPDVVAKSANTCGAVPPNVNSYTCNGGTSFAAPAITGAGILLQQLYTDYNPNFMRSSTLKGLMVHTAKEAGEIGPELKFGYGLVDVENASKLIINDGLTSSIEENILNNGSSYTVQVTAGTTQPIVATLSWLDPIGSSMQCINDLDLRISSTSGTEFPWVLDNSKPLAPAIKADNTKDVLEKILIPNPVPGQTYDVTVTHKGILQGGAQNYSLIISGYANCASNSPSSVLITSDILSSTISLEHANISIEAQNTIQSNATARYVAGEEVLLSIDFDALNGSTYDAMIGDCSITGIKPRSYNPNSRQVVTYPENSVQSKIAETVKPVIYPNPAAGFVYIKTPKVTSGKFQILDGVGNILKSGNWNSERVIEVKLDHFNPGVYFFLLETDEIKQIEKLVIQ